MARSREELIGQRNAIAHWARLSYGWMGRSPDYKASLMNALGANAAFYEKFAGNATHWYARSQNHVLFMNHAIVNPPVDRMKAADQVKDVFISIQKETDAGIVVSGARWWRRRLPSRTTTSWARTPRSRQRQRPCGDVYHAGQCAGGEDHLPGVL